MKERELDRSFQALPDPFREVSACLDNIASIRGISPSQIRPRELAQLYVEDYSGPSVSLLFNYVNPPRHDYDKDFGEKVVSLSQQTEDLLNIEATNLSYGLLLPSYLKEIQRFRDERVTDVSNPHKSLLVGALSPETIKEFAVCVRSIFPNAEPTVLDLYKTEKAKKTKDFASFVTGNAFQLPFRANAFDTVHTNAILDQLESAPLGNKVTMSNYAKSHEDFLGEVFTSLKSGGRIIMAERVSDDTIADVERLLEKTGFNNIAFEDGERFITRRDMSRFMLGNALTPPPESVRKSALLKVITADK